MRHYLGESAALVYPLAKKALEITPPVFDAMLFEATVHHQLLVDSEEVGPADDRPCDRFAELVREIEREVDPAWVAQLWVQAAAMYESAGEPERASSLFANSERLAPLDESVVALGAQRLIGQGKVEGALLLSSRITPKDPRHILIRAQLLADRNVGSDREEAIRLMAAVKVVDIPGAVAEDWHDTYGKLLAAVGRQKEASRYYQALVATTEREPLRHYFAAQAHRFNEDIGDSIVELKAVADTLQRSDGVPLCRRAILLAMQCKSAHIVSRLIRTMPKDLAEKLSEAELIKTVKSACLAFDEEIALALCARADEAHGHSWEVTESELLIATEVGAQFFARYATQRLANSKDEATRRHIRLRVALASLRLSGTQMAIGDASTLPAPEELPPALLPALIAALLHTSTPLKAISTAYELYRADPNSEACNEAVLVAGGFTGRPAFPQLPEFAVVAPGSAVEVQEDREGGARRWYVFEEARPLLRALREVDVDDAVGRALLGKRLGDIADIDGAFGACTSVKIVSIISKYLYRIRMVVDEFGEKFPDQKVYRRFRVDPKQVPERAFGEFVEVMQRQSRTDEITHTFYRSTLPCITFLAAQRGKTELEVSELLLADPVATLACCQGHPQEQALAASLVDGESPLVLDGMGLSTLLRLGLVLPVAFAGLLEAVSHRIVVHENVLQPYRELIAGMMEGHGRIGIALVGDTFRPTMTSGEVMRAQGSALNNALEALAAHVRVVPAAPGCGEPDFNPLQVADAIGRGAMDSFRLLAADPAAVLWTDDVGMAVFAATTVKSPRRVWTQSVSNQLEASKRLDVSTAAQITGFLISRRMEYTALVYSQVEHAGKAASWLVGEFPLKAFIEAFRNRNSAPDGLARLAALMICRSWEQELITDQVRLVWAICSNLAGHADAPKIYAAIRKQVEQYFRGRATGDSCLQTFDGTLVTLSRSVATL